MTLPAGRRLGPYEIIGPLGAGGMGEVYRARDTKLHRDVAIKVLPQEFSRDRARMDRFEREARLLAQLNHPNVATLYGLEELEGRQFLVMELVDGETLAERIARDPVPVEEAIPLFIQIAEGLEAAHEKGIVHRDLKPANIKVGSDGDIKILDFGLAKAYQEDPATSARSQSPTMTKGTAVGAIVGTAAYMSPEQARGKRVDKRTDVWAFGCVLFEALTQRAPFLGETVSDTIAKIIGSDPPWDALPPALPVRIRDLVERCLAKPSRERVHDIADARIELARAVDGRTEHQQLRPSDSWRRRDVAALWIAFALAGALVWSWTRNPTISSVAVTRSVVPLPPGHHLTSHASPSVAISPDGKSIFVVAEQGGTQRGFLRALDQLEAVQLAEGSEVGNADAGLQTPIFSFDGESVGFSSNGRFQKIPTRGGVSQSISETIGASRGAWWGQSRLVFTSGAYAPLSLLVPENDRVEPFTRLDSDLGEWSHRFPQMLPGDRTVLFTIRRSDMKSHDEGAFAVASLETGAHRVVFEGGSQARYSASGHLVYARSGDLYAIPFSLTESEVTGPPVMVVENVMSNPLNGVVEFALANGTLVYAPGESRTYDRRVVWVNREGAATTLLDESGPYTTPRLSPDGTQLVIQILGARDGLALYDLRRGTLTRLLADAEETAPVWSPDGRMLALGSDYGDGIVVSRRTLDGRAQTKRLMTETESRQIANSWSPDGKTLLYQELSVGEADNIWMLPLDGSAAPRAFLKTPADEQFGAFSPSGDWVAYESNESGRYEIFVCRFPDAADKQKVSTGGGTKPVWGQDGRELFYRAGNKMMAVQVDERSTDLVLSRSRELYERDYGDSLFDTISVTPDGSRFVDLDDSVAEPPATQLILVQNFSEELKRLVPTGN